MGRAVARRCRLVLGWKRKKAELGHALPESWSPSLLSSTQEETSPPFLMRGRAACRPGGAVASAPGLARLGEPRASSEALPKSRSSLREANDENSREQAGGRLLGVQQRLLDGKSIFPPF